MWKIRTFWLMYTLWVPIYHDRFIKNLVDCYIVPPIMSSRKPAKWRLFRIQFNLRQNLWRHILASKVDITKLRHYNPPPQPRTSTFRSKIVKNLSRIWILLLKLATIVFLLFKVGYHCYESWLPIVKSWLPLFSLRILCSRRQWLSYCREWPATSQNSVLVKDSVILRPDNGRVIAENGLRRHRIEFSSKTR